MRVSIIHAKLPTTQSVGRKLSRLVGDHQYLFNMDGNIYRIIVQDGYLFDGASIPWMVWSAIRLTPHGIMDGPALPHDLIYETQGDMNPGTYQFFDQERNLWVDCPEFISKSIADELLRALCIYFDACGKERAFLVWSAVATFGWFAWLRDDVKRKDKVMLKLAMEEAI